MTPKVILLPYYSVLLLSFQAILTLKIWCDNKPFRQWPEAWIWKSFDICHPKNFDLSSVHVEQGVLFIIHWCIRTQMQIFLCVSSSIFWTSTSPPFNQTQTSCGHKKMKVLPILPVWKVRKIRVMLIFPPEILVLLYFRKNWSRSPREKWRFAMLVTDQQTCHRYSWISTIRKNLPKICRVFFTPLEWVDFYYKSNIYFIWNL